MPNSAILLGNSEYTNAPRLECCRADVEAMEELLVATSKYDKITKILDADADTLKEKLRAALDAVPNPEELFFYFSGHGHLHNNEFFLCATNFDSNRPNETGVSDTELHALLGQAHAHLVVQVMDACYSGTQLIKSDLGWLLQQPKGFKNLIRFASCADSQTSLTGDPLSLFTEKFRAAALRKPDGVVYYTDISNTLRDEFLNNRSQIPHFISQHTGREHFVDDAKKLDDLRKRVGANKTTPAAAIAPVPAVALTLLDRLKATAAKSITPDGMNNYVGNFFDNLKNGLTNGEFSDFYTLEIVEHSRYEEDNTERFIISILTDEKRPDNFVSATHTRRPRNSNTNPIYGNLQASVLGLLDPSAVVDDYNLHLNCTMTRAQIKITFTPKFTPLQRLVLVVTCAPSLNHCYVFEMLTQHMLQDFGKYDSGGPVVSRRWWKLTWNGSTDGVVEQLCTKFREAANAQLENAEKRLSPPPDAKT